MQDHRGRLNGNKKGVLELPIKLMVAVILLSISLPIVSQAVQNNESDMMNAEIQQETDKLTDAMALAYYSGIGSSRTVQIDLPAGCEISVGGEGDDAYTVRQIHNGEICSRTYLDKPIVKVIEETLLSGRCSVTVTSVYYGNVPGIEVNVL